MGFVYAGAHADGPVAGREGLPEHQVRHHRRASTDRRNVADLVFAEEQGSFLVGAAAALKTKTEHDRLRRRRRGRPDQEVRGGLRRRRQGRQADVKVDVKYLSTPAETSAASTTPPRARPRPTGMYDERRRHHLPRRPAAPAPASSRRAKAKNAWPSASTPTSTTPSPTPRSRRHHHLDAQAGRHRGVRLRQGLRRRQAHGGHRHVFDLKADGVGYSTSGGQVDDIKAKLDDFKQQIIDGKIKVPTNRNALAGASGPAGRTSLTGRSSGRSRHVSSEETGHRRRTECAPAPPATVLPGGRAARASPSGSPASSPTATSTSPSRAARSTRSSARTAPASRP